MKTMAKKRFVVTISGLAVAFMFLLSGGYALSQETGMTTTSPDGTYSAEVSSPSGTNSDVSSTLDVSGLGAGDSAVSTSFGMAVSQYTENGPASSVTYGTFTASDNVASGAVNATATASNINGYAYTQDVPGFEDTMGNRAVRRRGCFPFHHRRRRYEILLSLGRPDRFRRSVGSYHADRACRLERDTGGQLQFCAL